MGEYDEIERQELPADWLHWLQSICVVQNREFEKIVIRRSTDKLHFSFTFVGDSFDDVLAAICHAPKRFKLYAVWLEDGNLRFQGEQK